MKTIDTNKKPELPWDWITVKKNAKYGKVPLKLKLYEPKGKTLEAVKEEVKDMRPANWAVLQYLYENPREVPEEFKNYWCYFFGTDLRGKDGDWGGPVGHWTGSEFGRNARWLRFDWSSRYRVVLLDDSSPLNLANLDLETLSLRIEKVEKILVHYNLTEV